MALDAQESGILFAACREGKIAKVEVLLDQAGTTECRSPEGWTPLIVAAFHGHAALCRALLDGGGDVNACNHKGTSVLMYAKSAVIRTGDRAILDMLLRAGANAGHRDVAGLSIYDYLERLGEYELAAHLRRRVASMQQWSPR